MFQNAFYRGDIAIETAKDKYAAGETIKYTVKYSSFEEFPLTNLYLVTEVIQGGAEHVYPSQTSDVDNIIYENVVSDLSILPLSTQSISLSYKIPADAKSGTYRIEAYLATKKGSVVGIPALFLAPQFKVFNVSGTGNYASVKISRTKTFFEGETVSQAASQAASLITNTTTSTVPGGKTLLTLPNTSTGIFGPIGVGVDSGKEVAGSVYVINSGDKEANNLGLFVSVCSWDDTTCGTDEVVVSKKYAIPVIKPLETKLFNVTFPSPKKPDAYAIRLELKDENNRTLSLYRSRIVVKGPGAKIRKLVINEAMLKKDESSTITLLASASPDYISKPKVKNINASVLVKSGAETIYSGSKIIPEMSPDSDFVKESFDFTPSGDFTVFTVCSILTSSLGEKYDEYCFDVDFTDSLKSEKVLSVNWSYDSEKKELSVDACSKNKVGEMVESVASIFFMDSARTLISNQNNATIKGCKTFNFNNVAEGGYQFIINDLVTGEQITTGVDASAQATTTSTTTTQITTTTTQSPEPIQVLCGDGRCSVGEDKLNCCADCGCPVGSSCENNACVEDEVVSPPQNNNQILIVLGAILLILLALYFHTHKGRAAK